MCVCVGVCSWQVMLVAKGNMGVGDMVRKVSAGMEVAPFSYL